MCYSCETACQQNYALNMSKPAAELYGEYNYIISVNALNFYYFFSFYLLKVLSISVDKVYFHIKLMKIEIKGNFQ